MSFYYAQINSSNIATCVSQLSGEVIAANMIPITEVQYNDGSVILHQYDSATNTWIYVPQPEPPQPIPVVEP
jgi:hypothetical protein